MKINKGVSHLNRLDYVIIAVLTIGLLILFLFNISTSYHMPASYNYDSDFGRDLLRMTEIIHGKPTLIGPQLSFAGLHMAPYSFYIFAPFLLLGNFDHRMILYVNALFFVIGFIVLYTLIRKYWNQSYAILSILWLATSPFIILAARSPGNGFSYLILLYLLLFILFMFKKFSFIASGFLGFLSGVMVNFHPVNVLVSLPIQLAKIVMMTDKSFTKLRLVVIILTGFIISFAPVLLFDLKHNFVITKYLFDPKQYANFFSQSTTHTSFLQKVITLNQSTFEFLSLTLLGLFAVTAILFFFQKKKMYTSIFVIATVNVVFLFLLGQGAIHYFFPTFVLLQLLLLVLMAENKRRTIILLILVLLNLIVFPYRLYQPARNLFQVEQTFNQIIQSNTIPRESLNIVLINDTHLSKVGYEYRYLLEKNGYHVDDEYSYQSSQNLLLISEKGNIDWQKETSWELEQFGNKTLVKTEKKANTYFYFFKKAL